MKSQATGCLLLQLLLASHTSACESSLTLCPACAQALPALVYLAFWDDNVTATNTFTSLTFTLNNATQLNEAAALGLTNLWNTES